jgi:hypothetical protein
MTSAATSVAFIVSDFVDWDLVSMDQDLSRR